MLPVSSIPLQTLPNGGEQRAMSQEINVPNITTTRENEAVPNESRPNEAGSEPLDEEISEERAELLPSPRALQTSDSTDARPSVQSNSSIETPAKKTEPTASAKATKKKKHPIKQIKLTWLVAVLTTIVYILTILYAFGNNGIIYIPWLVTSPIRANFVLRTLSEIEGILMLALLGGTFERVQWMLASRTSGVRLSGFLALGSGTSNLGLLKMIFRNVKGGRFWSLIRFLFLITVPILNVILFRNTRPALVFSSHQPFQVAGGIGTFNATYADGRQEYIQTLIAQDFGRLLQDNKFSFPIEPITPVTEQCDSAVLFQGHTSCGSSHFLHGGLGLVTPWPTINDSFIQSSVYQLLDVQGMQLDFRPMDRGAVFRGETDCAVMGDKSSALQLCFSVSDDKSLNAKYLHCPLDLAAEDKCLEDTSWLSSTGWTTSLSIYRRRADVQFSRFNMSTIAIENFQSPVAVDLDPTDMLQVFNISLNSSSGGRRLVQTISSYLIYSEVSSINWNEALFNLKNLVTIPIYYFQPTYMSPWVDVQGDHPDSVLEDLPFEMYANASFADPSYRLVFAVWTIWTYTGGMAALLFYCIMTLILGSTRIFAGRTPATGMFPAVDFMVNADFKVDDLVENGNDQEVSHSSENNDIKRQLGQINDEIKILGKIRVSS